MTKIFKRPLSIILAVLMAVSIFAAVPAVANAQNDGGNSVTLYFSNNKYWNSVNAYIWKDYGEELAAWPGVAAAYIGDNNYGEGVYSVTIDTDNYDYVIFNGSGGQSTDINVNDAAAGGCGIYCLDTLDGAGHYNVGYYEYAPAAVTINYTYNVYDEATGLPVNKSVSKTVAAETYTDEELVELNKPYIVSPYYEYGECTFTKDGETINATITNTEKNYTVTLNGNEVGKFGYMQTATVGTGEQKSFIVDGKVVFVGGQYSFYVCSDTDVTTDNPTDLGEYAFIDLNNVSVTNEKVSLDMLATANVEKGTFSRMGVAFALSEKSGNEIETAVENVTAGTSTSNNIAVHNSLVNNPNQSGQYQFRYAPFFSMSSAKDKTIYFYTYVVNKDGSVIVSDAAQYNMSNLLA